MNVSGLAGCLDRKACWSEAGAAIDGQTLLFLKGISTSGVEACNPLMFW